HFATNGHRSRFNTIGNMAGFADGAHAVAVQVRATPMRLRTATEVDRTRSVALVQANADPVLWVTTRLSGCTVLVMDWGNSLAMVHLQPYWPRDTERINISCWCSVNTSIRDALRAELVAIAAASSAQAATRYILVEAVGKCD